MAYNQAMASCSWEQAWSCMQSMRIAGVQPNTRSYNAVRFASRCLDRQESMPECFVTAARTAVWFCCTGTINSSFQVL